MRVDTCCLYKQRMYLHVGESKGFIWWSEITLHCFLSGKICNRVIRQRKCGMSHDGMITGHIWGEEKQSVQPRLGRNSVCMDISILL